MNIDVMRKIDFYLGVPITFLLTQWFRLLQSVKRPTSKTIQRLLFIELSEMGSTILADPAMRKARKNLNAELFFVIFKKNKPSLDLLKPIEDNHIFVIRDDNLRHFLSDVLRFWRWSRQHCIDTVIDLELFSRATTILSALSGAQRRVGFYRFHNEGLYRGNLLTHKVAYNPHIHIAKNFIALVNSLLSEKAELPYSKTHISDEEITLPHLPEFSDVEKVAVHEKIRLLYPSYDSKVQRLILFNSNASDLLPQRRWPQEHFVALAKRILATYDNALIVLTGAPSEWGEAERLRELVADNRCLNFAGAIAFQTLPVLYSISSLMLSNDSGPAHFAAVTKLPTFVIFGPETPHLYGPLNPNFTPIYQGLACSPCVSAANHRKTPCKENRCVTDISPEFVLTLLQTKLST